MKTLFSHLYLAHDFWQKFLQPGDTVIDATCGNGKDTVFLAKLVLADPTNMGCVIGLDIQQEALKKTRITLKQDLSEHELEHVHLICHSHAQFPPFPSSEKLKLIVYNLGYLPGGDHAKTTLTESTLQSLEHARLLLAPGGMISLTSYPGHPEGAREHEAILSYFKDLPSHAWTVTHHSWVNRLCSPHLFFVKKII